MMVKAADVLTRRATTKPAPATTPTDWHIQPVVQRRWRRSWPVRVLNRSVPLLAIIAGLALWQLLASLKVVDPLFLPKFSTVITRLFPEIYHGQLNSALVTSGIPFGIGMGVSLALGIIVGLLMGLSRLGNRIAMPWVVTFNSIPRIAFIPMLIVILGVGQTNHTVVVALSSIFPIILNVATGSSSVDPELRQMTKSFGSGRGLVLLRLVFPSTLPYLVTGLRLALGQGLIGIVVAELFASTNGIGYILFNAGNQFDTVQVYAMVIVVAFFGILFSEGLKIVERKLAPWRNK